MRIIAGIHRGRRLIAPPGDATRPITDRVKQSIFDVLSPLIPDARVYDCFSGTGSMGLECLSRGAASAVFFDADRGALKSLRDNIAALKFQSESTVIAGDIFAAARRPPPGPLADLIFLDPPYRFLNEKPDELRKLTTALLGHLTPDGQIIFRHDAADELTFDDTLVADRRDYGGMSIERLTRRP